MVGQHSPRKQKIGFTGALFALAILFALCIVFCAGHFLLDSTQLRLDTPLRFGDGWYVQGAGGAAPLAAVSRAAAGIGADTLCLYHDLDPALQDDAALCVKTKNERVRAYLDDTLVYAYGWHDKTLFGWEFGALWNLIPLSQAAGKTLRLELTPIAGRTGEAPYEILLGCKNEIVSYLFLSNIGLVAVCAVMLLIGLTLLILSLICCLQRDAQARGYFYFGVLVLLAGIWAFTDGLLLQFFVENKAVSYMLFNCSFLLLPIPFALFMGTLLPRYERWFKGLALGATLYFFLRMGLYLSGVANFETALFLIHLLMALGIVSTVVALYLTYRCDKANTSGVLALALLVLMTIEFISLLSFYLNDKLDVQRNNYASGFYFGFLLFSAAIVFGLIRRADARREQAFKAHFYELRAYQDDLTGLLNTKGFDDKAGPLLAQYPARRYAVLDFDVNHFSQYNARAGTDAGDKLIRRIADVLRQEAREGELCARLEADHFACLLYGSDLAEITERLRDIEAGFLAALRESRIRLCFGIVDVTDRTLAPEALRYQADMAKRTIKSTYSRNIALYDAALHREQQEELELLNNFDADLALGAYKVYYQPKFDIRTGYAVGAEALARYGDAAHPRFSPGAFIPLLEKRGLIARLDDYVFANVCMLLQDTLARRAKPLPVSVNFSRVHLYDDGFASRLASVAAQYGVPTYLLEIELVESVFLSGGELLRSTVDKLHAQGFLVSVDDFGSGYSSLNMLKEVPVDVVKLDKAFFDNFDENPRTGIILSNILRMTAELGIKTVAEGVETDAQLAFLQEHRCALAQGYYYARPMCEADFNKTYLS